MTVEELVKAYRELRAKERRRPGHSDLKSYANAGNEAMALNRSAEATTRFMRALTPLQKEIRVLSHGEELLKALTAESDARDRAKSARGDGSLGQIQASVRHELSWTHRQIKTLVHLINSQLESPRTETQEAIKEALETMAEAAKNIFAEPVMCQPVYLGPGIHEDDQSTWNVHDYEESAYVGTIHAVWPAGPGGRVEYEGVLFSEVGPSFRVTALVIATVLLHLGVELGRRRQKKVANR
jgi:hypothetical protein